MGRQHDDSLFGGGRHGVCLVVIFLQMLIAFRIRHGSGDVTLQKIVILAVRQNQIVLYLLKKYVQVTSPPFRLRAGLHLEELDALRQNDLAIYTLGGDKANLTVYGIQLIESLYRSTEAVSNPVVLEVTERNG